MSMPQCSREPHAMAERIHPLTRGAAARNRICALIQVQHGGFMGQGQVRPWGYFLVQNWTWAHLHAVTGHDVYYYQIQRAPPCPPVLMTSRRSRDRWQPFIAVLSRSASTASVYEIGLGNSRTVRCARRSALSRWNSPVPASLWRKDFLSGPSLIQRRRASWRSTTRSA